MFPKNVLSIRGVPMERPPDAPTLVGWFSWDDRMEDEDGPDRKIRCRVDYILHPDGSAEERRLAPCYDEGVWVFGLTVTMYPAGTWFVSRPTSPIGDWRGIWIGERRPENQHAWNLHSVE